MRFLISNDDGIESNGIKAIAEKLSLDNEVMVVAPDGNRSASSHSISISKSVKLKEYFGIKNCKSYALSGTPVDCIKFAKLHFKNFNPDVVIAGINKGHNLGTDILYSGTVSIACESAFFGNVAFAFSAFSLGESDFSLYADYAVKIIEKLLPLSIPGDIWNVNFPDVDKDIKGVRITKLGKQLYTDEYKKVSADEYVLVGELIEHDENDCYCDIELIKQGYITVTPISFDRTDFDKINKVKNLCEKL